jgi:hypothetical protein
MAPWVQFQPRNGGIIHANEHDGASGLLKKFQTPASIPPDLRHDGVAFRKKLAEQFNVFPVSVREKYSAQSVASTVFNMNNIRRELKKN